jgi:hypothetical protein
MIVKEALGMGKGDFSKTLSSIIDNHRIGARLIGKPRDTVLTACRLTDRFSEVANRPDVEVRLENCKVGPRKVKMLTMKQGGKTYPVPKGQLVDQLFPAKKIATTASPEKRHALLVRATMRRLVDQQLRNYRKTLKYPVECNKTGKLIRQGTKLHIDHVDKPFLQLADEFIAGHNMTYCDVVIYGPPNMKSFRDKKLQSAWQLFHKQHARLAPCLPSANTSAGAGEYQASEALIGVFEGQKEDDVDLDF